MTTQPEKTAALDEYFEHIEYCIEHATTDLDKKHAFQGLKKIRQALSSALTRKGLDAIIANWPEDAEWKPVQTLCQVDERMCFPVEKCLRGGTPYDGKDYILRDVVEQALTPRPAVEGFDKFVEMLDREPQYKPRLAALLKEHAAQTQDSGNEGGE